MIKSIFKLILLILLFGFISISPKKRYLISITLKEISSFLLRTVKCEDRKKGSWINQVGYLAKNLSHRIK